MAALATEATVAVIGAGAMGAGIAQVAAQKGHPVLLHDAAAGAVAKAIAGIATSLGRLVERGRLAAAERDAILARIRPAETLGAVAGAALVIEAVIEKLEVKRELFLALERVLGDGAILASNTSSLSITEIAAGLERPERVVGMHFFNPAPVMPLVEIVSGLATAPEIAAAAFATAQAWGKSPVHASSTPGFIANRIARPFYGEALRLLEEGAASVPAIDAILRDCAGFRMGPFELMDLIGIDVNFLVTRSVWQAFFNDPRYAPSLRQQEMVAAGLHGRKTGRGWYDYRPGAPQAEVPEAPAGIAPKRILLSQNPELAQARGAFDPAAGFASLAREAGIEVAFEQAIDPDRIDEGGVPVADLYEPFAETTIRLEGAVLRLARGETSHEPGWREPGAAPVVHYDLVLDARRAPRVALAPASDAAPTALRAAAGFFQAIGKKVSVVTDTPGLICMRTVAMLANEAADAVYRGACSAEDADTATVKGLNYPAGPLALGRKLGWHRIHDTMRGLLLHYGDPRYRVSPLIKRWDAETERRR